ncbi:MAG: CRISPR-associated endonuclease Cas3'', partial [Nitrososphaerales archaeon]
MESQLASQPFQFKLLAHPPDQLLVEHLLSVANSCECLCQSKKLSLAQELLSVLPDVCYIVGGLHDIGKATEYFQDYIQASEEARRHFTNNPKRNHSALSALFVYHFVKKVIVNQNCESYLSKMLPVLAYLAVKKHHSNLFNRSIEEETYGIKDLEEVIREQIASMRKVQTEVEEILQELLGNRRN